VARPSARLELVCRRPEEIPPGTLPEVALVGRSNVGKSAFINALFGRKDLAPVSGRPGKTRALMFYRVEGVGRGFYLVDLPGYGYARVSGAVRAAWGELIEAYLHDRPGLAGLVHVVDVRHPPTADDREMMAWMRHFAVPHLVAATKSDKLGKSRLASHLDAVRAGLGLPEAAAPVISFSARTGAGVEAVWRWLRELV